MGDLVIARDRVIEGIDSDIPGARNRKGRQGMKMQGEVHTGKTITDLSELVERAEAKAGCYGLGEASADDPVVEDPIVEEFEDSCGADAAAGKASDGACVEGLGERHGSGCQQGKDGDPSAMSSRSESQQNCAGLGAEWGIPPAGIYGSPRTAPLVFSTATRGLGSEFGAAADGAPFVAPSLAPYPGLSAAPKLFERSMGMGIGKGMEALILAQSCVLLSRALAYVGLADLDCARAFAVEIRDHLDAINGYALARGIGMDLAEAQLNLMSVTGDFAVSDVVTDAVTDATA